MSYARQERLRIALAGCPVYGILDESLFADRLPLAIAEEWLAAGIRVIQLRVKTLLTPVWLELARALREECEDSNGLLIVNDRVDIALLAGAHGVHLGEHDASVSDVRRVAPDLIIGGTARQPAVAAELEQQGADYLGCGSVFGSATKPGLPVIGVEGLADVCRSAHIPVLAIGGILAESLPRCIEAGATGVCMIQGLATAGNLSATLAAAARHTNGHYG